MGLRRFELSFPYSTAERWDTTHYDATGILAQGATSHVAGPDFSGQGITTYKIHPAI
jgi:hypothetical protein